MMEYTFKAKTDPALFIPFLMMVVLAIYFTCKTYYLVGVIWFLAAFMDLVRIFNKKYILQDKGILLIKDGIFSRKMAIDIQQISKIEEGKSLNLVLKNGQKICVEPKDPSGFMACIQNIQNKEE